MEPKTFNVILKILILIFGIMSIFLGFNGITISGVSTNPAEYFHYNFYFGVFFFPSRVVGSGYGISYNFTIYFLFIIIYIIGFLLNFGYFKKEDLSGLRKNLDLISVVLMGIGLSGSVSSTILTLIIFEIPPTTITFSANFFLLSGFYMAIIAIILVLIEFIILEKTEILKKIFKNTESSINQ